MGFRLQINNSELGDARIWTLIMKDPRLPLMMEHNVWLRAYIVFRVFAELVFQPHILVGPVA